MLQLLETGKALYVLAVLCGLGIFTRLITAHLYKRLMKESTNLASTRNRSLKELRQRAENTYRMNQGLRDSSAWLENQLSHLRFMGVTLHGWASLSMRWTWLCLLTGAASAFASYWYHLDSLYIVMYGGGAILMAMLSMLFDLGVSNGKHDQLLATLRDYIENVMCPRLARNLPLEDADGNGEMRGGALAARAVRGRGVLGRSNRADSTGIMERAGGSERSNGFERNRAGNAERSMSLERERPVGSERTSGLERDRTGGPERVDISERRGNGSSGGKKLSGRAARRAAAAAAAAAAASQVPVEEDFERQTEAEYIKQSLEQIAASREKNRSSEEDWLKELKPEEVKLLSDILKEYLV